MENITLTQQSFIQFFVSSCLAREINFEFYGKIYEAVQRNARDTGTLMEKT